MSGQTVAFRWLGVAGSEWRVGGRVLAIDPFFTRPPFRRMWHGRVPPDLKLSAALMPHCDVILVTHSHWDHVMDVPAIARRTGAQVWGSPNTCALMIACGVSEKQIRCVEVGDRQALQEFDIEVLPAVHPKTPVDRQINGPLASGLQLPPRLLAYRMDACFSFLIRTAGRRILSGDQPACADVWLGSPFSVSAEDVSLLRAVHPRLFIPIHWDNLFRPLSKGIRPMLAPPAWRWPPFRLLDVQRFGREFERHLPGTRVLIPEALRVYALDEWLGERDPGGTRDERSRETHAH